ncbi:hypothetical protein J7T55_008015 [Diaporthe amygdali]|uniref:uncharacterized protein n=1 Tax=Phomopsis amygdali TaxID=1214568 RepID=UPI0022FED548|nr:uncharacterized protein J7T55_008015 [Diaporthe amygdali]KAJ0114180.1 hypothetical protein J7T55_008015 [Diaporthe amygdali]
MQEQVKCNCVECSIVPTPASPVILRNIFSRCLSAEPAASKPLDLSKEILEITSMCQLNSAVICRSADQPKPKRLGQQRVSDEECAAQIDRFNVSA